MGTRFGAGSWKRAKREAVGWELGAGSWKLRYSYLNASIGSNRDALIAGNRPKKMPTLAENPMPSAKDHHGSETGKPEAQWTISPIALPKAMPSRPPMEVRKAASIR